MMQRILSFSLGLALVVALAGCGGNGDTSDETKSTSSATSTTAPRGGKIQNVEPTAVPNLTLETMAGESIDLAEQDGRLLLINFWATWCAPCREEIPDLKQLHSDLKPEGLRVIGIALDREGAEVVKPYAKKHKINYPLVIDTEGNAESELGPIYGLPTTVVVNPDGQIVKRVLGVFPVDKMKPELTELLKNSDENSGSA